MYKLLTTPLTNIIVSVLNLETHGVIPFDAANTDYQQYLKWIAEGNQPLPADE